MMDGTVTLNKQHRRIGKIRAKAEKLNRLVQEAAQMCARQIHFHVKNEKIHQHSGRVFVSQARPHIKSLSCQGSYPSSAA
jgi:hypothetical protein